MGPQISQAIIDLQSEKVKKLEDAIVKKRITVFKSPTGSGKTHMIAELVNNMMQRPENNNIVFFISTLSNGGLPQQMYRELINYKKDLPIIDPFLVSSVDGNMQERIVFPTDHNIYILPRSLFIDGKKIKGKVMGPFEILVDSIREDGKKIIWVRDECHQRTNVIEQYEEKFFKVVNLSATPEEYLRELRNRTDTIVLPDVIMTEEEAVNAKLIKKPVYKCVDTPVDEIQQTNELLNAITEFRKIKKAYLDDESGVGINPCLLIQISDARNGVVRNRNDIEKRIIKRALDENSDLNYLYISQETINGEKKKIKELPFPPTNDKTFAKLKPDLWSKELRENNCTVDIVIFKQIIKEGYDIPRACVLFQLRRIQSETFKEQLIGRIRRNPKLIGFDTLTPEQQSTIMDNCIVYGNPPSDEGYTPIEIENKVTDIDNISLYTTIIKEPKYSQATDSEMERILNDGNSDIKESIFDSYRYYKKMNAIQKEYCEKLVHSYEDWFKFLDKAEEINVKYKSAIVDYDSTMEVSLIEHSVAKKSINNETKYYLQIDNWLWKRTDNKQEVFFDSESEKEFAQELKNISSAIKNTMDGNGNDCYLWCKNFLTNSEICFEYYYQGAVKPSYPDFILKSSKDAIHLFESKSINPSSNQPIDEKDYKDKINALRLGYKSASKLLPYHFWIPIKQGNDWKIFHFKDGIETECTLTEMKKTIRA